MLGGLFGLAPILQTFKKWILSSLLDESPQSDSKAYDPHIAQNFPVS